MRGAVSLGWSGLTLHLWTVGRGRVARMFDRPLHRPLPRPFDSTTHGVLARAFEGVLARALARSLERTGPRRRMRPITHCQGGVSELARMHEPRLGSGEPDDSTGLDPDTPGSRTEETPATAPGVLFERMHVDCNAVELGPAHDPLE